MASRMEALGGSFPRGCEQRRRGSERGTTLTNVSSPLQRVTATGLAVRFPPGGLGLLRRVAYHGLRRLAAAELGLPLRDVIPGQWNRFLALSELELHDHVAVDAERGF